MHSQEFGIVICTYKREREMEIFLRSLSNQTLMAGYVCVVDGFHTEIPKSWQEPIVSITTKGVTIEFVPSVKNLAVQRNIGVDHCLSKHVINLIGFFDDDIILPRNYIEQTLKMFKDFPEIAGVAGIPQRSMEFDQGTRLDRLMKVRSPHPGQVLKSGENIGFGDPKKPYFVDWLPGCSMSFRSSIFTHLQFSSEFGFWGEDVHFSLKVQKFGKLMVFPVANLVHYKSASNRNSEIKRRWLQFVSRVKLHREFPEKISLFWVVISTLYQNTRYNLHHLKHFLKFSSNYLPLKYVRKIVFTFKKARRKIGFRVSL